MGLIPQLPGRPVEVDEYDVLAKDDLTARQDDRDIQFTEESRARVESFVDLNKELIKPGRLVNSAFHQGLMQDLLTKGVKAFDDAFFSYISHPSC